MKECPSTPSGELSDVRRKCVNLPCPEISDEIVSVYLLRPEISKTFDERVTIYPSRELSDV